MIPRSAALFLVAVITLAGCKKTPPTATSPAVPAAPAAVPAAPPTPAPIASQIAPPVNFATAGSISGVVHFDGVPPARIPIDMSADPACNQPNLSNRTEQIVANGNLLANVYVYVKSGAPTYIAAPNVRPVLLNQVGCRYSPHVIVVQQGGSVAFINSDATVHNIHTLPSHPGNTSIDLSEPADSDPRTQSFSTPEVMLPVRCNNHPWMSAFINVAPNPWFAVTGAEGTFTITGIPPGTYTLAAVHEKLGEQDIQITIAPKSVANASFTLAAK